MAKIEKHIVQEGQNIYDVCIQHYGSIDGLAEIMALNAGLDIDLLYAGQEILYTATELNANVLKSLSETQYIPATSSDMLPTPVPPPTPSADAVVIHQYGVDDIEIPAPGEYTVIPPTVEDGTGTLIATLAPGEVYIDPVDQVTITYPNSTEVVVDAPGTFDVPVSIVRNGLTILAELSPGEDFDVPGGSVDIVYPNGSTISVVAPDEFNVPASTVHDATGTLLASLSPGGDYVVPTGGIAYQRVPSPQLISYTPGDIGWCVQNGRYNWAEVNNPIYTQCLDNTVAVGDWFYRLKHNNAFGNKYRFTDAAGNPATDFKFNFGGGITYAIDHLTGLGFWRPLFGYADWATTMSNVQASTSGGYNDWMPLVSSVLFSVTTRHSVFVGSNLAIFTGFYQTFWLGETIESLTSNALRTTASFGIGVTTKTSLLYTLMFRVHYK